MATLAPPTVGFVSRGKRTSPTRPAPSMLRGISGAGSGWPSWAEAKASLRGKRVRGIVRALLTAVFTLAGVSCAASGSRDRRPPASAVALPATSARPQFALNRPLEPTPLAHASGRAPSAPPLADVVAKAQRAGKPILLVFGTVWCKPCSALEHDVLRAVRVATALDGYVVQAYDAETGSGVEAAKAFGVTSFPTLMVLSRSGVELDRLPERDAPSLARALRDVRPAARRAPLDRAALGVEGDLRALLYTGTVAERAGNLALAEDAYRAAARPDGGPVAARAAFRLMVLESRAADSRAHGDALLAFVGRFPRSDEAIEALAGLAALPAASRPDASRLRAAAATLLDARRQDQGASQRVSEILRALDLQRLEGSTCPTASFRAPEAKATLPIYTDPLNVWCMRSAASPSAEVLAAFQKEMQLGRVLVERCKDAPRNDDDQYVRLTIHEGRVDHAVLLDPQAPVAFRACVEGAALHLNVPARFGKSHVLRMMFPPSTR